MIFNYLPIFANLKHYVVVTDSMEPIINVGDAVWMNEVFNVEDLVVDDIIAFYADINNNGNQVVVIHYIANITQDLSDNYIIETKRAGVTNPIDWDTWQIPESDLLGLYQFHAPYIGRFFLFVGSLFGKVIIIFDIVGPVLSI